MPWIKTIAYQDSQGHLRRLYDRIKGPDDKIDDIMLAHSLRPHSMEGHMALYKNVLHHHANRLPESFLEVLGVWVSLINRCGYCVEHHFAGLCRLLQEPVRARAIRTALEAGTEDLIAIDEGPFSEREKRALTYTAVLTRTPAKLKESDFATLRKAGFDDGEILEINQVSAYFAYANRTVLGLGCSTKGDILGLSPSKSDDPEDWSHR